MALSQRPDLGEVEIAGQNRNGRHPGRREALVHQEFTPGSNEPNGDGPAVAVIQPAESTVRIPPPDKPPQRVGWFRVDLREGWIERAEVLFISRRPEMLCVPGPAVPLLHIDDNWA